MLAPGTPAPDFELPNDQERLVRLATEVKQGPLIVYFYPADFTPGCTREACAIRDLHDELTHSGLRVLGISPQSPESHRRFRAKYQLPFALLADETKAVIRLYDCDGPFGFGVRRASYLIDRKQRIAAAVTADFRISEHSKFFREAIEITK